MLYPTQLPSVQKTLTKLLSVSTNRSCADCKSTLVDPSQIHASVSPALESSQTRIPRYKNFRLNHQSFAPPSADQDAIHRALHIPTAYDPPIDPALVAATRVGGHGVFVCSLCGAAHKLLGNTVAVVHSVQDVASWSREEVKTLALSGGNDRSLKVLEAFIPHHWESKRPKPDSDIADRLTFIRAKYEALAFVLPPPGPLAFRAWRRIVKLHPEWQGLWGADLHASTGSEVFNTASQIRISTMHVPTTAVAPRKSELPDRLVDYFCVVAASDCVDSSLLGRDLSQLTNPNDFLLVPQVADCFPLPDSYGRDQEFPEHVSTFLFPDGCRPSTMSLPPSFFTFVLTASNGDRLYGGVLRLYDDNQDLEYLRQALDNSNYEGKLPMWMHEERHGFASSRRSKDSAGPDVIFLPKCLVVISHYPFFDLWRKFLLQIYRIALVGAPLPIERFIANFTCEVPLPPPGKIRIKFGFTTKDNWCIERPPENQLPLADFSFQPLFASLSINNVLLVFACMLQEARVALVSKYYGILGPVAEALTSLLFPFHWEGMYLPVLPYHMLDILDAPVPFVVGLHSRYLQETPPKRRPHGVVFVDLDRDEVHLGFEDNSSSPRELPCLPERQATKLKGKLDVHAASAYLVPPSGQIGTVTIGEGEQVPLAKRGSYLSTATSDARLSASGVRRRRDVFSGADKAYRDNELQVPIHGFLSEHGQFFGQDHPTPSGTTSKSKLPLFRRGLARTSSFDSDEPDAELLSSNILDRVDVSINLSTLRIQPHNTHLAAFSLQASRLPRYAMPSCVSSFH